MADAIYKSDDGQVVIDGSDISRQQFNQIMEFRGCPVRAEMWTDTNAAMLAAWDWLALKVERVADGR